MLDVSARSFVTLAKYNLTEMHMHSSIGDSKETVPISLKVREEMTAICKSGNSNFFPHSNFQ